MLHVIVPYRNRAEHLAQFIPAITRYLAKEKFRITVVEQLNAKRFNRGMLLNAGFLNNPEGTTYVALHDVDHLPIDVDYSRPAVPTDLLGGQYYDGHLGGVTLFPVEQYAQINGMSNEFWGWGGEDDDLSWRVKTLIGFRAERVSRFKHLHHGTTWEPAQHAVNVERLKAHVDPMTDGLKQCWFEVASKRQEEGYGLLQVTF